jgi:hypothetical protein
MPQPNQAQDCKIVLNLFDDDITLPPPPKKQKLETKPAPEPAPMPKEEPLSFKSQLPPVKEKMPPPKPVEIK